MSFKRKRVEPLEGYKKKSEQMLERQMTRNALFLSFLLLILWSDKKT
jgi:hypothetical protein